MIETLLRLVDEIRSVKSKLILLVGAPGAGKTALLNSFAQERDLCPLNVGAALGRRLAIIPQRQRHLQASNILRELAEQHAKGDLLLVDNIELLFDRTLRLDPLVLLKRHAHATRVVAVWPGVLREQRLTYAEIGHPERQDYGLGGLVYVEIK